MTADGFSVSRRTSILPSDCRSSCILYRRKKEHILFDDFIESGIQIGGLAHPALIFRKEIHKPSYVRIYITSGNQYSHMES